MINRLKETGDFYRVGGLWCPFFHDVANFFGMENYFLNMYSHPEIVHSVTKHVVDFYLKGNDRLFTQARGLIDAFFFGVHALHPIQAKAAGMDAESLSREFKGKLLPGIKW